MSRLFPIIIVIIFTLSNVVTSPETYGQKRRSRSPRQRPNLPIKDKEESTPIDKLFKATAALEAAWNRRSMSGSYNSDDYILLSAMADNLFEIAKQAGNFIQNSSVKQAITLMSITYRDAVHLHGLSLEKGDPLPDTRASEVRELENLRTRWFYERDPVVKEELWVKFQLMEAVFKSRYGRPGFEERRAAEAKEAKARIDRSAKEKLSTYGLENQWDSAPFKTSNDVFNIATKASLSIRACLRQPASCDALPIQRGPSSSGPTLPAVPTTALVGTWKLDFVAGNKPSQLIFTIAQQGHSYSGALNQISGQVAFGVTKISEKSFSAVSNVSVNGFIMKISGTVEGDRMDGMIAMTDAGGGVYTVSFTGTRVMS